MVWGNEDHLVLYTPTYSKRFISPQKAVNGFRESGIFPYNPDIFTDEDYFAADNYEKNQDQICANNGSSTPKCTTVAVEDNPDDPPPQNLQHTENIALNSLVSSVSAQMNVPSTSKEETTLATPSVSSGNDSEANLSSILCEIGPKVRMKKSRQLRGERSEILTSSPYTRKVRERAEATNKRNVPKKGKAKEKSDKQKPKKRAPEKLTPKLKPKRGRPKSKEPMESKTAKKKLTFENEKDIGLNFDLFHRKPQQKEDPEENAACIICTELFLDSKSGESWISCNICSGWAHNDCTDYNNVGFYVCDSCRRS